MGESSSFPEYYILGARRHEHVLTYDMGGTRAGDGTDKT